MTCLLRLIFSGAGGGVTLKLTFSDGSCWFSWLMASPVMSKPPWVGEHHRLLVEHHVGAARLHQPLQDRAELGFHLLARAWAKA